MDMYIIQNVEKEIVLRCFELFFLEYNYIYIAHFNKLIHIDISPNFAGA